MQAQRKFGRLVEFDERSRQHPVRALIRREMKRRSYTWRCAIMLDQGSTSACTGFAVCHEAAARPVCVAGITNRTGHALYSRARALDQWPGEDYDGSSVLGAMKAGKERGWYGAYRWAFGEEDLALAVGYCGPAVLGLNWYAGMSECDKHGMIRVRGRLLGGHAILCNGYNAKSRLYRLHNSWGKAWGLGGEGFISAEDMRRLLAESGEAGIPIVRTMGRDEEK